MSHHVLDARRLLCPLPVIRAQDRIAALPVGDTLEVICTDPGAMHDIPAWARIHGHSVVECRESGHDYIVTVRVEAGS